MAPSFPIAAALIASVLLSAVFVLVQLIRIRAGRPRVVTIEPPLPVPVPVSVPGAPAPVPEPIPHLPINPLALPPQATSFPVTLDQNGISPPSTYPQIGYLRVYEHDVFGERDRSSNGSDAGSAALLPLHGTRSNLRRGRCFYYTIMSGIKVPVWRDKRDCLDSVGCEELFDGDKVWVIDTRGRVEAVVTLHKPDRDRW